ncbi:MAG TPA: hypothetical protein VGY14_00590 [Methyloceanibacter sp.]|nr:hypothetical protein [Methyloceanibacter sp.]
MAQVERRQLPVLQGKAQPQANDGPAAPAAAPPTEWTPRPQTYAPALPQSPGTAQGESTLPPDLWRGLEGSALARLLAQVPLPSPSPALAGLLARALATNPEGAGGETAMRVAALEGAGRVNELTEMSRSLVEANEPGAAASYALALLAAGRTADACSVQLGSEAQPDASSKRATFLIPVYCAAFSGDKASARQALNVARGNSVDVGLAASAVDGRPPRAVSKNVDVLDYLFLKLGQAGNRPDIAAKASPELLFLLARDDEARAELRLAAAERAASLNVIDGETLAAVYREAAQRLPKSTQTPAALRAKLFAALEGQTSEGTRADSIDALLTSGKDARIEIPMAQAMAQAINGFAQDTQADFAETGVRVAALAGDDQTAWDLTESAGAHGRSWQLLLVTTDPSSKRAHNSLESGVDIALKAGLPGPLLQRLVTVLDALGEEVPIPLWDLAAKTPQPDDGYLPATGLLSTLKEAADAGDVGRTILLAACVFGPDGPQGAHLIALGDGLRALKRVGLDAEARRLAFEALYAHWPARGKA